MKDDCKQGNFKAILKYRAKGDEHLKNILEGCEITYTSPKIQNEIIEACNTLIVGKIVKNVNASKCFTLLADETCDISTSEHLSICVRYITNENQLREEFLQFFVVESLNGVDLASSILNGNFINTMCYTYTIQYIFIIFLLQIFCLTCLN